MTCKCGLDVRSKEIFNLVDEILPSGSSLTEFTEDFVNNVWTTKMDDLNETIIPGKLTKGDLSQLEVEKKRSEGRGHKHSKPVAYKDLLNVHSEEILNLVDEILISVSSLTTLTE